MPKKKSSSTYQSPLKRSLSPTLTGLTAIVILTIVSVFVLPDLLPGNFTRGFTTEDVAAAQMDPAEQEAFNYVNQERTSRGLSALTFNSELYTDCSSPWAVELTRRDGNINQSTGHNPNQGSCGPAYVGTASENVAWSPSCSDANARAVVDAWMASDDHRPNILESGVTRMAMARAATNDGRYCWVNNFRGPAPGGSSGGGGTGGGGGGSSTKDTTRPTSPNDLKVISASYKAATLQWSPASDNVGVYRYEVYRNGTRNKTVTASTLKTVVGGLQPETTYRFTVLAVDRAGNRTDASANPGRTFEISYKTPAKPSKTEAKNRSSMGNYSFDANDLIGNTPAYAVRNLGKWHTYGTGGSFVQWRSNCGANGFNRSCVYVGDRGEGYVTVTQLFEVKDTGYRYKAIGRAFASQPFGGNSQQRLYLDFLDASFTHVGSGTWVEMPRDTKWHTAATQTVTAPANATYVRVYIFGSKDAGTTSDYFWDYVRVIPYAPANR